MSQKREKRKVFDKRGCCSRKMWEIFEYLEEKTQNIAIYQEIDKKN